MEELWLNEYRVDLPSRVVSQTLQINDLAELKDRQVNFTNRFYLPPTPLNIEAMKNLGIVGNTSRIPYERINAKYVVDGIELVSRGEAQIKKTSSKGYEVYIYDGTYSLYSTTKDKSLKDLDFSEYDHAFNITNIINSFSNTSGYVYGLANFNSDTVKQANSSSDFQVKFKDLQLSFFIHTIFSKIIEQAGATFSGEIFNDETYLEKVITVDSPRLNDTSTNISEMLPDINQYAFIKDVMQKYGLIFRVLRNTNHYEFIKIEDLFNDRENAEDWSEKFTQKIEENYTIGNYAQQNIFKYKYSNDLLNTHDNQFNIDNVNLKSDRTLLTSIFQISEVSSIELGELIYNVSVFNDNGEPAKITPRIFTVQNKNYTIDFVEVTTNSIGLPQTDVLQTHTGDIPFLTLDKLNFSYYINNYYNSLVTTINNSKKVVANFLLSVIDVYNINFFKLKYISQLGAYFYLNKIRNFKNNKVTKCEIIQVFKGAPIDDDGGGTTEFLPPVAVTTYLGVPTSQYYGSWSAGQFGNPGSFTVDLYGNLSYDPQGLSLTFGWHVISAPSNLTPHSSNFINMNGENSIVRFRGSSYLPLTGNYVIRLTVANSARLIDTTEVTVTIS
ncbi:hypothetical protein R8G61_02800 [Tenacibaculum maritimum]